MGTNRDGEVAALKAMVNELVMDLENEIDARYPNKATLDAMPIERRRYERDMDVCRRARAMLASRNQEVGQ